MTCPPERQASTTIASTWDAALYDRRHAFVWEMASDLVVLLAPKHGERVLDLGCGTGHLTKRIAETGATVVGLDQSESMIAQAKQNYPDMTFVPGDARDFRFDQPFDAVFSNAVLHWVTPPEKAVQCVARALKQGGRLVLEMGGKGNIRALRAAIDASLDEVGASENKALKPWYNPSVAEYSGLLESHGLLVTQAALFSRPTPLEGGPAGIANWMRMFGSMLLANLPPATQAEVIARIEDRLRPSLWHENRWVADYVRLRVVAVKRSVPEGQTHPESQR
ncbi:MAG: class I SAM-dependent methyltransferase [Dehalococcoidia bacterium]|nr:class I SAM-dependent methyltransferase [Dehalococcoidia bacterium]